VVEQGRVFPEERLREKSGRKEDKAEGPKEVCRGHQPEKSQQLVHSRAASSLLGVRQLWGNQGTGFPHWVGCWHISLHDQKLDF
jgi:hypothetical protein